LPEGIA